MEMLFLPGPTQTSEDWCHGDDTFQRER